MTQDECASYPYGFVDYLKLYDSKADEEIDSWQSGDHLCGGKHSIEAVLSCDSYVKSVKFYAKSNSKHGNSYYEYKYTDNAPYYFLYGGYVNSGTFKYDDSYDLWVTPYSEKDGKGKAGKTYKTKVYYKNKC